MNRIKSPTPAHLDQLSAFLEEECEAIKLDDIEIADRKKAITQLEANMHQNPLLAGKSPFFQKCSSGNYAFVVLKEQPA